jgi:ketosteroid isomerase-like protein
MTPTQLVLSLSTTLTLGCVSTHRSPERTPMPTAEQRLTQAYRDMASANLEGLMQLYTPDALILSANQPPVIGVASIRAMWVGTFERFVVRLAPEIDEVTDLGDLVVVRGRATGVLAPKTGADEVPVNTWFLQLYQRHADGTLRFWRGANGPAARTP